MPRRWLWLLGVGLALACAWPVRWPAVAPSTTTPIPTVTPRATSTPDLAETLDYDIEYWSLLIPGLYHLYGSVLDEFILARITNPSEQPVRLVLEAQIEGFTDWATATVSLSPGATETVPLHPVLHPQAIDTLTHLHPANLHIACAWSPRARQ
ncbi:MAG: hypothetical protein GXO54_07055 [Chloroflexi bacterium]|nr:hypothetical protein [Chloroflexota bacterium]